MSWKLPEFFTWNGREVRYGRIGNGPPVVLVHGTPWSSFNMRHLVCGLSETHTVYYFDLLGYGASDRGPGDVSLAVQNKVLVSLVEFWELERPAVIGHDFGGATVLRAHLLDGKAFEKIVLIDPVALSPWGSPFFRHVREHEAAFAGVPDFVHEAILKAYIETAVYEELPETVLRQTLEPWIGEVGKAAFYRQIAQADSIYTEEVEEIYPSITSPVLLLWGKEDSWIPVDRGRKLTRLIPTSRLRVIRNAGHLVIEERPDALLSHIEEFLSRPGSHLGH